MAPFACLLKVSMGVVAAAAAAAAAMAGGCVFYLEPRIDDAPKAVTHVIRGELLVGDAGCRGRKLGQQVAHDLPRPAPGPHDVVCDSH